MKSVSWKSLFGIFVFGLLPGWQGSVVAPPPSWSCPGRAEGWTWAPGPPRGHGWARGGPPGRGLGPGDPGWVWGGLLGTKQLFSLRVGDDGGPGGGVAFLEDGFLSWLGGGGDHRLDWCRSALTPGTCNNINKLA